MFGLNGVTGDLPYIVHTPIRRQAIKDMAAYVGTMIDKQVIEVDDDLTQYLKRFARLTEYSERKL